MCSLLPVKAVVVEVCVAVMVEVENICWSNTEDLPFQLNQPISRTKNNLFFKTVKTYSNMQFLIWPMCPKKY